MELESELNRLNNKLKDYDETIRSICLYLRDINSLLQDRLETFSTRNGFILLNNHRVHLSNIIMYYPNEENEIIFLIKDKKKITLNYSDKSERDEKLRRLDNWLCDLFYLTTYGL